MDNMLKTYDELKLLVLAGLILLAGLGTVSLAAGSLDSMVFAIALALAVSYIVVHYILRWVGRSGDKLILPVAAVLTSIGLVVVFRLKPELFLMQALWVAFGLVAFILAAVAGRRVELWADYKYIWGAIGIILLLSAEIFGVEIGGNKNWLIIGPIHLQPAEFAKLFIVMFFAAYLSERRELLAHDTKKIGPLVVPHKRVMAPLLAIWGIAMIILVLEHDLGAALLFFGTALLMIYLASGRYSYLIWGGGLFLLGSVAVYVLYHHVRARIDSWLNPWADPSGASFQIVQSLFALGSGGVMGSGLGYGFPNLIPEVHTDFIFSAIGEELGLLGSGAVLLLYMILVYRVFKVALAAKTAFNILLAGGLAILLALQTVVIVGGVTKFMPLTGVALPLISYGGSSMVATFILLGLVFAVSEAGGSDA
ncbi:MAG: cell cycle protein [Firmicutes bacterium]|nr:cell cycle protein [Bacillota bacterium]